MHKALKKTRAAKAKRKTHKLLCFSEGKGIWHIGDLFRSLTQTHFLKKKCNLKVCVHLLFREERPLEPPNSERVAEPPATPGAGPNITR